MRRIGSPAAERFASASYRPASPLDLERLATLLAEPSLGVLRAKGLLRDRDGTPKSFHLVGARTEIRMRAYAEPAQGRLVCIGLRGGLDHEAIAACLRAAATL